MSPLRLLIALFLITLCVLAGTHGAVMENSVNGAAEGPALSVVREKRKFFSYFLCLWCKVDFVSYYYYWFLVPFPG